MNQPLCPTPAEDLDKTRAEEAWPAPLVDHVGLALEIIGAHLCPVTEGAGLEMLSVVGGDAVDWWDAARARLAMHPT